MMPPAASSQAAGTSVRSGRPVDLRAEEERLVAHAIGPRPADDQRRRLHARGRGSVTRRTRVNERRGRGCFGFGPVAGTYGWGAAARRSEETPLLPHTGPRRKMLLTFGDIPETL